MLPVRLPPPDSLYAFSTYSDVVHHPSADGDLGGDPTYIVGMR